MAKNKWLQVAMFYMVLTFHLFKYIFIMALVVWGFISLIRMAL